MKQNLYLATLCLVTSAACVSIAFAQDYSNVTTLDGMAAKAVILAASQMFDGRLPSLPELRTTSVMVGRAKSGYDVTISKADASRSAFYVNTETNAVVHASDMSAMQTNMSTLTGIYTAALLLSNDQFIRSKSPLKPKSDFDVQLNVPYTNLPNLIYVVYMPRGYAATKPTPLPIQNGVVTLGCTPVIWFSVDLASQVVKELKPSC